MSLLQILILLSFALWAAAAIPGSRVPEWAGRAGFFVSALVWVLT